ncbi:MAG: hypothetical protein HY735_37060 [Verrucomicrobia bacterium]|nr:hypothetical protein [Verrucomicrobiota bacterium]
MASLETLLKNPTICAALRLTWRESQPGPSGGHEEGGFVVQEPTGTLRVIRWPKGAGNVIHVPAHLGCRIEGAEIVASFHTHPNTGADYLQQPSETDKRAVRDDPDLKSLHYAGELVISAALVYGVTPSGSVMELGETERILAGA